MVPDDVSNYLIDELLPEKGLVMVWGKPKCLKSFWVLDATFHIARGWPYHDRAVRQGGVVYCAFEGGYGYKKRVSALRIRYGLGAEEKGTTPLMIVPASAPNLVRDHTQLVRDVREQLADWTPQVVVLDTLNKSISGSESKDEDMAAYIRAAEAIRNAFDCLVVIVHHCGWDESRPRGHSSLPGAVDAQIRVERAEDAVTVTVELMRDGPEGVTINLRADEVVVGYDRKNHKDLTSLVLTENDAPPIDGGVHKRGRPDVYLPVFLKALSDTIVRHGRDFCPDGVETVRAADMKRVAAEFHRNYATSGDPEKAREAERKRLDGCIAKAREDGRIKIARDEDDVPLLWFTRRGERA
jgi:hypothetical protein